MVERGDLNSVFLVNKILKRFFEYAVSEGFVLKNPCKGIILPKKTIERQNVNEVDPFTDGEIKLILENSDNNMRIIFLMGICSGLRRGEILGLRLGDVDLQKGEVSVNGSLKRTRIIENDGTYENVTIYEDPKTKNSFRKVPISDILNRELKKYINNIREKWLKLGLKLDENSYIFTTETCSIIDGTNLLRTWNRTLSRAGVRYRKFHNTRHTFATKLFEQGVPLKTVQMLLGHANISITSDTYIHVIPKQKEDAVNKLNYLFNE